MSLPHLFLTLSFGLIFQTATATTVPQKFLDRQLNTPAPHERRFSTELIESKEFIHVKSAEWKACHQRSIQGSVPAKMVPYAAGEPTPPIEEFIESPVGTRQLQDFEKQGLHQARVSLSPWSADYWAYAGGILGARYMDRKFTTIDSWLKRFNYIHLWPANKVLEQQGQNGVTKLSPSEKYDLLVGDSRLALTNAMWAQGKSYYDEYGNVEEWMGICHGWAAAAIVEPRPVRSIEVQSLDQKWKLSLNPSEIKGLVSYSWATNPYASAFLGERCNDKDPKRSKNGRILNPDCFDLNPATWHLAVVHLVGQQKRSFVMDATFDYEVWNQPVVEYSYRYFNPKTRAQGKSLENSRVRREEFKNDPYAEFRSKEARSFVGIQMKVAYVVETDATSDEQDSPELDAIRWVQYEYDLELNAQGEIIGGEWYTESHPDFIWIPKPGARPTSPLDEALNGQSWETTVLPQDWARAAQKSSPSGIILNSITDALLKKASAQ